MKKRRKSKKKVVSGKIALIPAYDRFCNPNYDDEIYKWQGWGFVIRHLREYTSMDQAVFGRLLQGYTRGQISRYEIEDTEPPIDFWVKMMRTFGVNINWVYTGQGEPYIRKFQDSEERLRFFEWARLINEKENFLKELKGWQ